MYTITMAKGYLASSLAYAPGLTSMLLH